MNILKHPSPECPQLKIVRIDGSVFFGAVSHVAEQLDVITREDPEQAHILIAAGGINFIDVAGCALFAEEARRPAPGGRALPLLAQRGGSRPAEAWRLHRRLGGENLFPSKSEAVRTLVTRPRPGALPRLPGADLQRVRG